VGSLGIAVTPKRLRIAIHTYLVVLAALAGLGTSANAGGGPRDVAVVVNTNSYASTEIGEHYAAARGIPADNICRICCSAAEEVSWQEAESIRAQIRSWLDARQAKAKRGPVDYIVLTRGIPLKAQYLDTIPSAPGPLSLASVLLWPDDVADLNGDGAIDDATMTVFPYGPVAKSTYGSAFPPVKAWSYLLFDSNGDKLPASASVDPLDRGRQYYLVTRLDAYSVEQVKQTIDRGLCPATAGAFALDRVPSVYPFDGGAYKSANDRLGDQYKSAYYFLVPRGLEVLFDAGQQFLCDMTGLMGYFSWGSHDTGYTPAAFMSNSFVPGSIADTYFSFSAKTFQDNGEHPLMADLFPSGVCGAGGYVSEPLVSTATYPSTLFDRYTQGYNMAESFYAACCYSFWKTVVIGDPLMAPYATAPEVSVVVQSSSLVGNAEISADASDDSGISKVAFYINDDLIGIDTSAPFSVTLDTTDYRVGPQVLEAIAYENTVVATQGSGKLGITIDNLVSAIEKITEAVLYPNGQWVRLKDKIVTAGTQEIGDGFYIEDLDRTSGLKVLTSENFSRGDQVTVIGEMDSVDGQRVMKNVTVTRNGTGRPLPGPIMMNTRDLGGAPLGEFTVPVGDSRGPRNVSLLIRVFGKVTSSEPGEFCLTDSSCSSPIRVVCPGIGEMPVGAQVAVTGICIVEPHGCAYRAGIRARDVADIRIVQ